jgi:hypothetical protein
MTVTTFCTRAPLIALQIILIYIHRCRCKRVLNTVHVITVVCSLHFILTWKGIYAHDSASCRDLFVYTIPNAVVNSSGYGTKVGQNNEMWKEEVVA